MSLFVGLLVVYGLRIEGALACGHTVPAPDLATMLVLLSFSLIAQILMWSTPRAQVHAMSLLLASAVIHWWVRVVQNTSMANVSGLWIVFVGAVTMIVASCIGLSKAIPSAPKVNTDNRRVSKET